MMLKEIITNEYNEPFIIAETAFSHEGSKEYLLNSIDGISNLNNVCIKLQILIDKDGFLSVDNGIYEDIDKWILTKEEWIEVIKYAGNKGVEVIVAVIDDKALDIVIELNDIISGVEIHPSCIPDYKLVSHARLICEKYDLMFVLGISGFRFMEIEYLMSSILTGYDNSRLLLMYGFQNYPTSVSSIRMDRIDMLKDKFNVNIGYADHTEFNNVLKENIISMAYGRGINIFEVHYVNEIGVERLDYITAVDSKKIGELIGNLRLLKESIGNDSEDMSEEEVIYSKKFRKIPLYNDDFSKGHVLNSEDISYKRSNNSSDLQIHELPSLTGKKLKENVLKNKSISLKELSR